MEDVVGDDGDYRERGVLLLVRDVWRVRRDFCVEGGVFVRVDGVICCGGGIFIGDVFVGVFVCECDGGD